MGLFDILKRTAGSAVKKEDSKTINNVSASVNKGGNRSEYFVFASLPSNLAELRELPEASLDSPFKAAALTVAALCRYGESPDDAFEMLDFLKGPESVSNFEKQFIKERLEGKEYKAFAFFEGATPENNYQPDKPFKIQIIENPYSFDNENWAMLYVKSAGADSPSGIKLRKKPSANQWFLNDIQCLSDIRVPVSADPWA